MPRQKLSEKMEKKADAQRKKVRGQTFGSLTVIEIDPDNGGGRKGTYWRCSCSCGGSRSIRLDQLTKTDNPSCGCQIFKNMSDATVKHGFKGKTEYHIWNGMKQRCLNSKNRNYRFYGALGIKVCDRWLKFENFLADMGRRPHGLTLDRIESSGNYEPGNCRWATYKLQENNRKDSLHLDFFGIAEKMGITYGAARQRWRRGKLEVPKLDVSKL